MDRRAVLIGGAALASLTAGGARAQVDDLKSAAREAFVYGAPLMEMARLRAAAIGDAPGPATPGYNGFVHARAPAGAGERTLSGAEPDVLYSSAWIDLSGDGVRIDLPAVAGRYVCFSLFDMYGNALETIEGREIAQHGHSLDLMGPPARVSAGGYSAPLPRLPHFGPAVRAPGKWVWALARIHLEGEADLAGAHAVQDSLQIHAQPKSGRPAPAAARNAAWTDHFFALQNLMLENPPPADETGFFHRIVPLQLGMQGGFEQARFADADLAAIGAGVEEARRLLAPARADGENGWLWPKADVGDYGQDFLYRAQTMTAQPGSPAPTAICSLRATGPDGALAFAGDLHYRLRLPTPPPAGGFWSLTIYEAAPDGRLFLAENPIGRYSLGAWTPGLKRELDGALEVWIGRGDPGGRHTANWLPAPQTGAFALVLRAYAPQFALTEHSYPLSPVEQVGNASANGVNHGVAPLT
jgi:hypothetical protein